MSRNVKKKTWVRKRHLCTEVKGWRRWKSSRAKKKREWMRGKEKETKGNWFNGLMRPSSSQLFCVRHSLTFRFTWEPRHLIFHILAITLTLEALADSRLWPFHSDRAFPLQPSTPCMNSPPFSIHLSIKFVVRTAESTEATWNVRFTSVMGSLTAWPLLKGVTTQISCGRKNGSATVREEEKVKECVRLSVLFGSSCQEKHQLFFSLLSTNLKGVFYVCVAWKTFTLRTDPEASVC